MQVAAGSRSGAEHLNGIANVTTFNVDATDEAAVAKFVAQAEALGPVTCAVFNAGAFSTPASILEMPAADFERSWRINALGAFHFGQSVARVMEPRGAGTIIFTGATASTRGGARFAAFAASKNAARALAQSMARELGPRGIHVAHTIIDGGIQMPSYGPPQQPDARLEPDSIAAAYLILHEQHRSCWTMELDMRPYCEKF